MGAAFFDTMELITFFNGINRNVHHRAGLDVCRGIDGSRRGDGQLGDSGIINLVLLRTITPGFISLRVWHAATTAKSGTI